ncbi:MAG: PEGA domain-containing protein [Kofleriaceae bacterium]
MMNRTAIVVLVGVMFGAAVVTPARAGNRAAEAAFKRAKQLAKEGKWNQACKFYEQSYREEPQLGALLNVANCHEQIGLGATALEEFREAAALAKRKDDDRERYAIDRARALDARVGRLRVIASPRSTRGVVVRRDGVEITSKLGVSVALDPGEYVVDVSAPGFKTWQKTITIGSDGETHEVAIPTLEPRELVRPAVAAISYDHSARASRRKLAVAVGVIGLAGIGIGTAFGVKAMQRSDESYKLCPSPDRCNPRVEAIIRDGKVDRRNANIAFGIGAAGVVTGVVLWVTAPSHQPKERRRLSLVPTRNGLAIRGKF